MEVVYDGVGKDTFYGPLDTLATFGRLVNFGQSSGPVASLAMPQLAAQSTTVIRPIIFHYTNDPARLGEMAADLFDAFARGILTAGAGEAYALAEAGRAHEALGSRTARGPLLLVPEDDDA